MYLGPFRAGHDHYVIGVDHIFWTSPKTLLTLLSNPTFVYLNHVLAKYNLYPTHFAQLTQYSQPMLIQISSEVAG